MILFDRILKNKCFFFKQPYYLPKKANFMCDVNICLCWFAHLWRHLQRRGVQKLPSIRRSASLPSLALSFPLLKCDDNFFSESKCSRYFTRQLKHQWSQNIRISNLAKFCVRMCFLLWCLFDCSYQIVVMTCASYLWSEEKHNYLSIFSFKADLNLTLKCLLTILARKRNIWNL